MHSLKIASSSEWLELSSDRSLCCRVERQRDFLRIWFLLPLSTGDDDGVPHMLNLCINVSFCAKGIQLVGGGVICRTYGLRDTLNWIPFNFLNMSKHHWMKIYFWYSGLNTFIEHLFIFSGEIRTFVWKVVSVALNFAGEFTLLNIFLYTWHRKCRKIRLWTYGRDIRWCIFCTINVYGVRCSHPFYSGFIRFGSRNWGLDIGNWSSRFQSVYNSSPLTPY